jgi:hypothetical protein
VQACPAGRDEGSLRPALWAEAGRIRSALPGVDVSAHLVHADAAPSVLALQHPGTLLVLGTGSGGVRGALLRELVDRAPGALLVVPPGGGRRSGPVVAAVDGSAAATAAAVQAAGLAVARRQAVVLVHAVPDEGALPGLPGTYREELLLLADGAHLRLLQEATETVAGRFPEVPAVPRLVHGPPKRAVPDAARGASLVALGRQRRRHGPRFGRVTGAVLERCAAPILLLEGGSDDARAPGGSARASARS